MRVLINTASTYSGGGLQVARSVIEECATRSDHQFHIVVGKALSQIYTPPVADHISFSNLSYRPAEKLWRLQDPARELKAVEAEFKPDVVFTTSGPAYWRPKAPHLMGFNLPHYLYSDSPFFSRLISRAEKWKWRLRGRLIRRFARRDADAWVAQTDDVRRRLIQWLSRDSVFTVHNTISASFLEHAAESLPMFHRREQQPFRVLVLSLYHRHKNLELIDDIIALYRKCGAGDLQFMLALPDADFKRLIRPENRKFVENHGVQRPEQCPSLYSRANIVFLPTLLECFSANYVEAMCMSRPVVTTDLSFAREICQGAALYFQPLDAQDALQKILRLRDNEQIYDELVAFGRARARDFGTAARRMDEYLALCEELAEGRIGAACAGSTRATGARQLPVGR